MTYLRWGLTILVALLGPTGLPTEFAHAHADSDAPSRCAALATRDFSDIADAPTRIIESKHGGDADTRDVCRVTGYVTPSTGFLVALPSDWNGKLIQLGCGGFCGSVDLRSCDSMLRRGYACSVSDNGHKSTVQDALWAYGNLQAEIDHAYRATHVTALASKAIVESYYDRAPLHSYFMGASSGGRQGMMAAQRFPWDFDGIVAGAPSLSVGAIHTNLLWANRSFTDSAGRQLFTQHDLDVLNRAVVERCDLNDGVQDGLIGDPRICRFQPDELRCGLERRHECLSTVQIEAANKIYGGAVNSRGESLYTPAVLKGSERTWLDCFSTLFSANPRATYNFVREEFRYAAFQPDPGPAWKPEDFDFDRDYKRLGMTEALSAAINPDLRRFNAAGGKLLAYAGWSDAAGMPLHTADYYETVERLMGGRAATQDFFRLFLIPGMGHGFGEGAFAVDWLSYLEAWVERGEPPSELMSSHVRVDDLPMRRIEFPLDPKLVKFTRPLYPYPIVAKYSGRGNPNVAASFMPAELQTGTAADRLETRSSEGSSHR